MARGPIEAARAVDDFVDVESAPRLARQILIEIIESLGWHQGDDAASKAEEWEIKFLARLQRRERESREQSNFIKYTFNSADSSYIQGSCFCEPSDDPFTRDGKQKRAGTLRIANQFANLTPAEFEKLCGAILILLDVEKPYVSRSSADQGVDFYGSAPMGKIVAPESLPAGVEKNLRVWLVGQAKHYPRTKVSTSELRELIGSTEMARSKVFAGTADPLQSLEIRLCDPVFYMLITSGEFTADSRSLILKAGIVAMDGLQLAQFLADHGLAAELADVSGQGMSAWLAQQPLF